MRKRPNNIDLVVIQSTTHPEYLSLRGNPNEPTATQIRKALVNAGYKPGDKVKLIPVWPVEN